MSWDWAFWIGGGAVGVGALVLLVWAMVWDRSRGQRRCGRCWYDMSGTPGLVCPECEREAREEKQLIRTRRRWGWAAVALAPATGGIVLGVTPAVSRGGWSEAVPIPVLSLALPLFDASAETVARTTQSYGQVGTVSGVETRWQRLLVAHGLAERVRSAPTTRWVLGMAVFEAGNLSLGAESEPLIRQIVALMESDDPEVRIYSIASVTMLGVASDRIVTALITRLQDSDEQVRLTAVRVLGWHGGFAARASRPLERLTNDPSEPVRVAAQRALGLIREDHMSLEPR